MSKPAPAAITPVTRTSPFFDKCYRYDVPTRVREAGVYSFFRVVESAQDPEVIIEGRRFIMLGSNNYLGLTNDPRVKEAAIEAIRKFGSGCAGSRFLNGTLELHVQLEERLAKFTGKEAALVYSTGYLTNLGSISALMDKGDVVVMDKDAHACIVDGARLSPADVKRFRHNDVRDLERVLSSIPAKARRGGRALQHGRGHRPARGHRAGRPKASREAPGR